MHRLRRSNLASRLLLALGVAGAAFAIATAVQAAIPSAGGLIHACYQFSPPNTGKGVLRVIDAENRETCRVNERPLSWNQTGPTGTRGPTGPTGTAGPTSLRTASTNFVPHEEDDLVIHRVTAEEAGLTILTNPCLVTDYDGT